MKSQHARTIPSQLRPYLFITLTGILAFAPVSFMLRALKNDITAIEYPINYFISQCIHNGEIPYWFNTWGMGFPLQSNLTWGIFSTPQLLFSAVFDYNMVALHIEFIFFLLLSGWSMFFLLKKHFVSNQNIAQVLAIGYMLSGFTVGSSQWLLYITATAFIPLVIHAFLQLLQSPSARNALLFAILYSLMFTSVYAAFSIITTYGLIVFLIIYLLRSGKNRKQKWITVRFAAFAGLMTGLLCLPCLYYTLELLPYMDRGNSISTQTTFFNSNYLHPASLSSMLFPFSSVRMRFPNTEGTMLDTYTGLFTLLFLPAAIRQTVKEKNHSALFAGVTALFFLLISFGSMTPLRNALNNLPGFSYFRNPGLFRLYFILSLVLYLGILFRHRSLEELFNLSGGPYSRILQYTFGILAAICLVVLLSSVQSLNRLTFHTFTELIRNIHLSQAIFVSSCIQLIFLSLLFLSAKAKYFGVTKLLLVADLIINTLVCTPYFTVSSYSLQEVGQILQTEKGFPVQHKKINEVAALFTDEKQNTWNNINVFRKQVSSNETYWGPLTLKEFSGHFTDSLRSLSLFNRPIAFAKEDPFNRSVKLILQKPTHIRLAVIMDKPDSVTVLQNYFPGWQAFYNNKRVEIVVSQQPGMTIKVPPGEGVIDLRYERKAAWSSALLLHLIILSFLAWKIYQLIKRSFRSAPVHS